MEESNFPQPKLLPLQEIALSKRLGPCKAQK